MTTLAAARVFAQDLADSTGKIHIIWYGPSNRYFVLEIGKKPIVNKCEKMERFVPKQLKKEKPDARYESIVECKQSISEV